MSCRDVVVRYDEKQGINSISIDVSKNVILAMIGPSGCGKSTFLRCLIRMNDTIPSCMIEGSIYLDSIDIYDQATDVVPLRARVGMVFQKTNPFPKSIYDNVAYGLKIHGLTSTKAELDAIVTDKVEEPVREFFLSQLFVSFSKTFACCAINA